MKEDLRKRIEGFIIDYENTDLENMAITGIYLETAVDLLTELVNDEQNQRSY